MVVMASLLGAQELRDSLQLIRRCQYRMTGRVLVSGVPHKPQGDSKSAVLSLNGGLLPKFATPLKTRRQGERKKTPPKKPNI